MITGIIVDEHTSPVAAERLWRASIGDIRNLMPRLLPQLVSSIVVLEGDGGAGTIMRHNLKNAVKEFGFVKDRIEVIDHDNHIFKYSVIEGGLVGLKLKSFTAEITFSSTREGGCLAKVKIEYESMEEGSLLSEEDVTSIKEGNLAMMKAVEEYLLADPNAYV
ncbi:major pollen allergen Bet v 1-D/H-like [Juglans microcarpa x Juglans regia]|uniref:major pollen allergen Bet v 1-D/H-like n=1 Tax=Juglans microcarpa x Juglans regia TaxID=2249226 RepID=UPI001B7E7D25|nr:major pollen allergen Bet v 1-D/H-like [Juglans microcarpa x Juglans regia]XP_040993236.1 major pollen allergen Bet v 1-D/H-like [Juglans microcarpa x Juglans regia]